MKTFLLFFITLFYAFFGFAQDWNGIAVPADAGTNNTWQLQANLSDDFNYTFNETSQRSNFGSNKWYNFYHNGWDGPGTTYWQYDHVSVNGGDLTIRSSRNPSTAKMGVPGVNAGCITSNNRVKYPVYVEANVSVANIALASDVWLLSPDDTQEIDIIECYGGAGSGNSYFAQFIHLSHHSFVRSPFQDYQPRDLNSWWGKSGVSSWGEYCWNSGNRRYIRIGVNWIGPKHFEYYIEGELVRVLYDKAFATKNGGTWYYTYPTMSDGILNFGTDGYQSVVQYGTSTQYSFQTLQAASNASNTSVIDPYNFQGGYGFTKELDIIINVESQDWHVADGRTPSDTDLEDPAKNTMKVDWIRVYKPVADGGGGTQTPYNGSAHTIPGIINAVEFDNGGEGVAYHDATTGNSGTGPRQNEHVDTEYRTAAGNVGWIATGEWLEYSVNVTVSGTYTIDVQVASISNNGKFHIEFDGNDKTGVQSVSATGGWASFVNKTITGVSLTEGQQIMRIFMDGGSFNLGSINITAEGSSGGGIITVQAENLNNHGGTFNDGNIPFGVGVTDGVGINWVNKNDWAEYYVSIPENGAYEIVYYISSPITGSTIDFSVGGTSFNTVTVPNNGSWEDYNALTVNQTANFTAGNHMIRLTAGGTDWTWNLDKFTLQRVSAMKSTKGAVESLVSDLLIYPNPADEELSLSINSKIQKNARIEIHNMLGKMCLTCNILNNNERLDLSHLNAGPYIITIVNGDTVITQQLIKQ